MRKPHRGIPSRVRPRHHHVPGSPEPSLRLAQSTPPDQQDPVSKRRPACDSRQETLNEFLSSQGFTPEGIGTRIEQLSRFYPAEYYYQKYKLRSVSSHMAAFDEAGYDDEAVRKSPIRRQAEWIRCWTRCSCRQRASGVRVSSQGIELQAA